MPRNFDPNKFLCEDFAKSLKESRERNVPPTDVTLISKDGKMFPVHSLILSIRSSYFKKLFSEDKRENYHFKYRSSTLANILDYIYGDEKCMKRLKN